MAISSSKFIARKIPGYSDYYITEDARVFSIKRDSIRELSPCPNSSGYYYVTLDNKAIRLHRLVAKTFLGLVDNNSMEVNHKDFDKSNNTLDNLEVVTKSHNMLHAYKAGKFNRMYGESNHRSKLTDSLVRQIKELISNGLSDEQIANKFNLRSAHINKIRNGNLWGHIKCL